MVSDNDKILVERYLDGSLHDNELSILRARLENEPALSEHLRQQEELKDWTVREKLVSGGMAYLKSLEVPAEGESNKTNPVSTTWSRYRWIILLGILALLISGYLLLRPTEDSPIIDHRPLAVKMADQTPPETLAYNEKDFAKALPLLREANALNPAPAYQLAIAVSFLETDRPGDALPYLEALSDAPLYREARLFYQAYAFLHLGREDEASALLDQLPDSGFYGDAGKRLRAEFGR